MVTEPSGTRRRPRQRGGSAWASRSTQWPESSGTGEREAGPLARGLGGRHCGACGQRATGAPKDLGHIPMTPQRPWPHDPLLPCPPDSHDLEPSAVPTGTPTTCTSAATTSHWPATPSACSTMRYDTPSACSTMRYGTPPACAPTRSGDCAPLPAVAPALALTRIPQPLPCGHELPNPHLVATNPYPCPYPAQRMTWWPRWGPWRRITRPCTRSS